MEAINQAIVVRAGRYYDETAKPLYEHFLVLKPSVVAFGIDTTIQFLRDASQSLFLYYANQGNMRFDIGTLVDYVDRYARIYYRCVDETKDGNGILTMLRCIIRDHIRGYNLSEMKYDTLAEQIYQTVREMITVTK